LLSNIKSLEERVLAIKNSDALPFSFFSDSFHKTQEISQLLHELELLQIEEMKHQWNVGIVLSEAESRSSTVQKSTTSDEQSISSSSKETPQQTVRNRYAEGIVLPEYKNPRSSETGTMPQKPSMLRSRQTRNQNRLFLL